MGSPFSADIKGVMTDLTIPFEAKLYMSICLYMYKILVCIWKSWKETAGWNMISSKLVISKYEMRREDKIIEKTYLL